MDIVKSWQVFWEKFGPGEAWRRVLGEGLTNTLIIAFAGLFGMLVTNYNMSKVILGLTTSITSSPTVVLIFVSIILFVAGMFIDSNAAMLMLIPIFAPLIRRDRRWWAAT